MTNLDTVSPNYKLYNLLSNDEIIQELASSITYNPKLDESIIILHCPAITQTGLLYLKETYQLQQLIDICGVDFPKREHRFEIVYQLLSLTENWRLCLKVMAKDQVPTVSNIYLAAGWYEREIWDLYGINFDGHKDMRRLLTDYGFEGHPLRKDFPLFGEVEVRYDEKLATVIQEPVSLTEAHLTQDYRDFDFRSPWQGRLPGDEKAKD